MGRPVACLIVLVLLAGGCSAERAAPVAPTLDPTTAAEVAAIRGTFGAYRAGVASGAPGAVLETVTPDAVTWFADLADLARTAGPDEVRALPATAQLLTLTLRAAAVPAQLQAMEDGGEVLAFLVEGGFAGQDRAVGGLGEVTLVDDGLALGVVTREEAPTPLRWRFLRVDGAWRFDLLDAHRLNDDAIATAASRTGQDIAAIVRQTLERLTGAPVDDALYQPPT